MALAVIGSANTTSVAPVMAEKSEGTVWTVSTSENVASLAIWKRLLR